MDQVVSALNGPNPRLQHNERERSVIPDFVSLHEHLRLIAISLTQIIPHPDDIRVEDWSKYKGQEYWQEAHNPLFMAASIAGIDTHFSILDDAASWCRPAYEYDQAKDDFVAQYVKEATRFMWTWIALEQLTKNSTRTRNYSQVYAYDDMKNPNFLMPRATGRLVELLKKVCGPSTVDKAYCEVNKPKAIPLIHYQFCRSIRNSLMHDSITDVEPIDGKNTDFVEGNNDFRVVRMRVACRLVVFTIQEILVRYLCKSPAKTEDEDDEGIGSPVDNILPGVELWRALKFIHLTDPRAGAIQLTFPGFGQAGC